MKAAVLGSPISHSLSPILHRAAYTQLGLEHTYDAIELTEDKFVDFIAHLDESWLGFSLTMPLKEVAFEVANQVSSVASQTRSINTLIMGEQIKADNTDVFGISRALSAAGCTRPISATILGAGATARSSIAALAGLGVQEIVLIARNVIKSAKCIDLGNELGITVDSTTESNDILFSTDVLINTTPKGVADDFAKHAKAASGYLLEVIYDPWPTKLAMNWMSQNKPVVPGHQMLLHQAFRQVELMTGFTPDLDIMAKALDAALTAK